MGEHKMFSFRNIVLVLLLQVVHGQYEHSVTFGDGKFQLQWSVVDRQLLKVRLTGETDGWVGFGIANEAQMVGSDVVIAGLASDGSAVFDDRFAEKRMLPKKDIDNGGVESWSNTKVEKNGNKIVAEGERPLTAQDQWDSVIRAGPQHIIWALSSSSAESPSFHNLGFSVEVVEFFAAQATASCDAANAASGLVFNVDSKSVELKNKLGGNVVIRAATASSQSKVVVNGFASKPVSHARIQATRAGGVVTVVDGDAKLSNPDETAPPLTTAATKPDVGASTEVSGNEDSTTTLVRVGASSTTGVNGAETTTTDPDGVVSSSNRVLSFGSVLAVLALSSAAVGTHSSVVMLALLGTALFQAVQAADPDCLAADFDVSLMNQIDDLTASTVKGDVIVESGNQWKSASLQTDDGEIHAKFDIESGSTINVDFIQGTNLKFDAKIIANVLTITVNNFHGSYKATMAGQNRLSTVGDITEYSDLPGSASGYVDFGDGRLIVESDLAVKLIATFDEPLCADRDCQSFELRFDGFKLPDDRDTTYACWQWPIPANAQVGQIVRIDPIVASPEHTHHILVFTSDTQITNGQNCAMSGNVLYAWAVGIGPFELVPEAGLPLTAKYITLSTHYDNSIRAKGVVDYSGLKFYVAPPRPHVAGLLWTGSIRYLSQQGIAPGKKDAIVHGVCSIPKALVPPTKPLTVFGTFAHAHKAGKKVYASHQRLINGVYKEVTAIDSPNDIYDFNRQEFKQVEPFELHGGDRIITTCHFDTSDRTQITKFGDETSDEMCFVFLLFYDAEGLPLHCLVDDGAGVFSD